jgi:hypothetical protein
MHHFQALAQPWWVNLLAFIPFAAWTLWRRKPPAVSGCQLILLAVFASAFGFVESAVVIYLRAATGLLPGYHGTLSDVRQASAGSYKQEESISEFPESLFTIEVLREAATMMMLTTVALLAGIGIRERCAIFLWTFAVWDISYYAGLWATVRWPSSLKDLDVLFLIPVPWVSQVWFPILISFLSLVAVLAAWKRGSPVGPARRLERTTAGATVDPPQSNSPPRY